MLPPSFELKLVKDVQFSGVRLFRLTSPRPFAVAVAAVRWAFLVEEADPAGHHSTLSASTYFEDVDYVVCLNQVSFLLDTDDRAHEAVFWQVVFGSGDFVLQNPDGLKRRLECM